MAIRFSNLPVSLEKNRCYKFMLLNYTPELEVYSCETLIRIGSLVELKAVLDFGAVVQQRENLKLTYLIAKTLPNVILELCRHNTLVFTELLMKINNVAKKVSGTGIYKPFSKCDAAHLKNMLSYLMNFHQIQLLNMPFSGLSIATVDHIDRDAALDWVFSLSDKIEVMKNG
jgi:hypothetical protein